MRILMINVVCGIRSTGRICTDLATALESHGHEVRIAYGRESVPEQYKKYAIKIGSDTDIKLHGLKARLLDGAGFGSKIATIKFIKWIKEYNPDVIHLHNIHGYYINIRILFEYLKTCGKKIIWTLHDCWSFTGHCVFFDYVGCERWKTGCGCCPQKTNYPARIGPDRSRVNYKAKEMLFTGINNMTLVTPSKWLANLVSESFLREYRTLVIHNGVDINVFKPTSSSIKEKYNCVGKKIVLGVAAVWDNRKGLSSFINLAKMLDDSYKIILVGLKKEQVKGLPKNIIGIEHTDSPQELAALYSSADVFVNPTLEDNYPTTNIEAIACGTPVISYETGGSPESANMFGCCVPKNDVELLASRIQSPKNYMHANFDVDNNNTVRQYYELYIEK